MFVQAKCPNCGGILAVDKDKDAAVCQYCNTPFIIEKAINNFNVQNMNVENANITINNGKETAAQMYEKWLQLRRMGNNQLALQVRNIMEKEYPTDYRLYWMKVIYITSNFTLPYILADTNGYKSVIRNDTADARIYYQQACNLAPGGHLDEEKTKQFENFIIQSQRISAELQRQVEEDNHKLQKRIWLGVLAVCAGIALFLFLTWNI